MIKEIHRECLEKYPNDNLSTYFVVEHNLNKNLFRIGIISKEKEVYSDWCKQNEINPIELIPSPTLSLKVDPYDYDKGKLAVKQENVLRNYLGNLEKVDNNERKLEARWLQDKETLNKFNKPCTEQDLQIFNVLPENYVKWKEIYDRKELVKEIQIKIESIAKRWNENTGECILELNLLVSKDFTKSELNAWLQEELRKLKEKEKQENISKKEKNFEEDDEKEKTIKGQYLELVKDKKWNDATELLAKYVLSINKIYTTKEDIKSECWIYNNGVYISQGKSQIKEDLRKLLGKWYNDWIYGKVMEKIEPDTFINSNEFFCINHIDEIPVLNGILNVITRELKPFSQDKIFFNKLPIIYNPSAECPSIEKHLKDVLKFEEDINVMYEIIGFLLYKDYFLEKMIMLIGDGRNGKGKTIDLIRRFLGVENCASIPLSALNDDNFRVSGLFGKMANLAGDLSNTSLKDTGILKQTTGRDLIGANRKFLTDIKFINYAKHIFACNELPKVYDMSKGFWSRWIVLEFPYEFISESEYNSMEKDKKIMKKILDPYHIDKISSSEELSGLLNKSLDGLKTIRENKVFSYSKGTEEIKKFWIRKSDSFIAFCFDNLEEDAEQEITKKELRKTYHKYCSEHKLKGCSDKAMAITLQEMFGVIDNKIYHEGITTYLWQGIKFKPYSKYNQNGGKL